MPPPNNQYLDLVEGKLLTVLLLLLLERSKFASILILYYAQHPKQ
jgi:hypothetical protein